jgi:YfiH family protein
MSEVRPGFLVPDWPAPPGVRAVATTRIGGVSYGPWAAFNLGERVDDDPAAVHANHRRLANLLALPGPPQWLLQIHGADAVAAAGDGQVRTGDSTWTRQSGVVCAVQSADCLPVLLCDRAGSVVAAVHGGWRGLATGVIAQAVTAMAAPPDALLVWLGPAICGACYEVGDEVRAVFVGHLDAGALATCFTPSARAGHWLADLPGLARAQLVALGVPAASIHGGDLCTFEDAARFYSYRRDGITGRQAALIWRES